MPAIASGWVTAFFLFDVAEAIDLRGVSQLIGTTSPVRMAPKPSTPPYLQYKDPPITFDGQAVAWGTSTASRSGSRRLITGSYPSPSHGLFR